MKLQLTIYSALLSLTINSAHSQQQAKLEMADKQYDHYAYADAIKTYEGLAKKGYESVEMYQKLGNAYYFNANFANAEKSYSKLFTLSNYQEPEYYYRYVQCLKATGQYKKADEMMSEFNKKWSSDERAKIFDKDKEYLEKIKANSGRYVVEDAGINSEFSDFGSSFSNGKLVFASTRKAEGVSKKIFKVNNQPYSNLYESQVESNGKLSVPKPFQVTIGFKFHKSTPVYTKDGKTMYFTSSNLDKKRDKESKDLISLKIYTATQIQGKWTNIVALPFSSDLYSIAHPALSPDEKILYFASDMPGSMGESDLYKVAINSDGSYGYPESLGNTINTEGKETFPFVTSDNELYYATDGRPGLGGLDIFVAKIKKNGTFSESRNVGTPVNSNVDDFAFLIEGKSREGFFTSNREGGKGYDDIYKFTETKKLAYEQALSGLITSQETGELLPNAQVALLDASFKEVKQAVTDEKGQYSFNVTNGETYYVRANKQEYNTNEQKIAIPDDTEKSELSLALQKTVKPVVVKTLVIGDDIVKVGDDLAKIVEIKAIYFDSGKSFIRKDADLELAKILMVLQQNQTIKIDVRSHTDSRSSHKANKTLSDKRAKATVAWFIKKGIPAKRVTGKGYGESQLLNNCADGVPCTDAEHQMNRRSEFILRHFNKQSILSKKR